MSGKFINTTNRTTVNSLVEGFKDKMNNPYYLFTDKKPVIVTYYNQNVHMSTLDEAFKIEYSPLGDSSPLRFNRIDNFYLYGIDKIINTLENGEWGLESDSITGEAVILPNTIIPIANDYFFINHSGKTVLFKVTSVSTDTLENDANFYRIEYKLDQLSNEQIEKQTVEKYDMVINNIGTKFNPVIRKNDFNFIVEVEDILTRLKNYYINVFYSPRVQTFILDHNNFKLYDPCLIEFMKKHEILKGSDEFIYIAHQTVLPRTFAIEYDTTFFRFLEEPDVKGKHPVVVSQAPVVDEYLSILCTRRENYYKVEYKRQLHDPNLYNLQNISNELLDRIFSYNKYDKGDYRNIIIDYCNEKEISPEDIYGLENINYDMSISLFYDIPAVIYIIEMLIKKLMEGQK